MRALYYVHEGIVSPAAVGVDASTLVLLWVVLGGQGTLIGPVVGAVVLNMLYLKSLRDAPRDLAGRGRWSWLR